jgi:enamine deaminase RidA (YjgF/YER057c/UK114 family)
MFAARSTLTSSIRRAASTTSPREFRRFVHIEKRLEDLGITLPTAPVPKANYNIICRASGNMMYISGHLPITSDGKLLTGRIGPGTGGETVEHGYTAARHCALNIVSTLKSQNVWNCAVDR